ncbi:hypothetical protein GCM10010269_62860 [Streptomyces humidus]|uniref:Uncharacterized protein n=1 Tax=Streptomyces humidus TaxID=52259 RepID=A0A918G268_9ACTN|nr:hypothetical protein [Streptomyces humidus]GGS15092.1 hypothetical protein GCM10010269_62860 [Streptomyces humidus]
MTLAAGVLLDKDFWGGVAQWGLILVGLFTLARVAAFAVTPRVVWKYQPLHWWTLAWTGWLLLVLASIPWTLFDLTGDRSPASIAAGTGMLVTGVVAFAALAIAVQLALRRPTVMSLPVPAVWWVTLAVLEAGCVAAFVTDAPVRGYTATGTVSAVGVLMFGFALGTRLKLRVTVRKDGKEDPVSTAYAVTRIATMGHKVRGLEVPKGTDAALPEDAVAALPQEGRVAAALLRIALSLFAIAPWRADIALPDEKTATVTLRRNETTADSTIIFRSELGLNGFEPPPEAGDFRTICEQDVLTAAGSFLFLCLAKSYPALREGLCGARHWRSLACQVLAGTPPWAGRPEVEQELLARAIDKDPGNSAARLSFLVARYGSMAETRDDQKDFIERLERFHKSIERKEDDGTDVGYLPLHVRTLWKLITARVNYAAMSSNNINAARVERDEKARPECKELKDLLRRLKGQAQGDDSLMPFYEQVEPNYRILSAQIEGESAPPLGEDISLLSSYNLACLTVERDDFPEALKRLNFALGLKENRGDALTDPVLRPLRKTRGSELMVLLDKPRLSKIEVLEPHVEQLEKDGICYPAELLVRSANNAQIKELAASLNVPIATVMWMRDVCRLVESCPDPQQAVAWTNLLTREGIDRQKALSRLDKAEKRRLEKLSWTADGEPLTRKELRKWAKSK